MTVLQALVSSISILTTDSNTPLGLCWLNRRERRLWSLLLLITGWSSVLLCCHVLSFFFFFLFLLFLRVSYFLTSGFFSWVLEQLMIIDSTVTLFFFFFSYLARLSSWCLSQLSNSFQSKATARLPSSVAPNRTPPRPQAVQAPALSYTFGCKKCWDGWLVGHVLCGSRSLHGHVVKVSPVRRAAVLQRSVPLSGMLRSTCKGDCLWALRTCRCVIGEGCAESGVHNGSRVALERLKYKQQFLLGLTCQLLSFFLSEMGLLIHFTK